MDPGGSRPGRMPGHGLAYANPEIPKREPCGSPFGEGRTHLVSPYAFCTPFLATFISLAESVPFSVNCLRSAEAFCVEISISLATSLASICLLEEEISSTIFAFIGSFSFAVLEGLEFLSSFLWSSFLMPSRAKALSSSFISPFAIAL